MNYRYKIFEIQTSQHGNFPGTARIVNDARLIGEILRDEIHSKGGAAAYGVECTSFAWFISGEFHYLLLREDDADFHIDLAMTHLPSLPRRPHSDFFPAMRARMSIPIGGLYSELTSQGFNPISTGVGLSHGGMYGNLFRDPKNKACPVFAAPSLPHLNLDDSGLFLDLMDDWFKQIRDILTDLKSRFGDVDIAFESGGTIPIPDWFKEWCRKEGIGIRLIERLVGGPSLNDQSSY